MSESLKPSITYCQQSFAEIINQGQQLLAAFSDSAKLDCKILLAFVLNKETSYLLTWPDKKLAEHEFYAFLALFERRLQGEPIAYITQEREFWSLPFYVSPATLIPRPDTELLVEHILARHLASDLSCLDLGTGTGAIALSLASEQKQWQVHGIDFSDAAISLAKKNAQRLQLPQVELYQSDWFSNVAVDKKFNIIVSNPPYIDEADQHLIAGDVRFEPLSALVARDNGFADIKRIAKDAQGYLTNNGALYFEHGFEQAAGVSDILKQLGYQSIETFKDYGGNDRVTCCIYVQKEE
ncbi:peptide chain release factor N(5)-glutamine methyltransferase [Colwellia sp. BRX9-1]|uniref:peptide chain release factor N(5)-glutamine methyltransferase n=1 Tax=Colwellia sp. BRX9-1 TaxID=2759830 RepID=UPI001C70C046